MFIGIREGGLVGAFQDPKMSKLPKTAGQSPTDLPQRVSMRQMAEHHCHKLRPTGETFGPAFGFVLGHKMVEFRTGNMPEQLTKQARYLYHVFNPPRVCAGIFFDTKDPIAQNPQEGIFIQKLFWTRVFFNVKLFLNKPKD